MFSLFPTLGHALVLASGQQITDIFFSVNISFMDRIKDGIGGRMM